MENMLEIISLSVVLLLMDIGLTIALDKMFSEKGFILRNFPSWKGTKKFLIFHNIFNLSMFSNIIVYIILNLIFYHLPFDSRRGFLIEALFITWLLLGIIYSIFFAIERKKEKKRSKILKFKISEDKNISTTNDPKQ